jgi:hypothetical protein
MRRLRSREGWSRNDLAIKLQILGMDSATCERVYKIEARYACVADDELIYISRALGVSTEELYPDFIRCAKRLYEAVCASKASPFGVIIFSLSFLSKFGETALEITSNLASV